MSDIKAELSDYIHKLAKKEYKPISRIMFELGQKAEVYPRVDIRGDQEIEKTGVSVIEYFERTQHPERFKKNGKPRKDANKRKRKIKKVNDKELEE